MSNNGLVNQLKPLPASPGIYMFRAQNGQVLYVGKAANLRSRVRSYFQRTTELSPHKQMMVRKIADIETITTSNEAEALMLESLLIKKHRPSYNVVLKDDKNYQFIKIDYRPAWPTVTMVRRPEQDRGRSQARYFGPYTSASDLYEGLRLLRRIFPWRKKPKEPTRFEQDLLQKRTLGPLPQTNEEYCEMITRLACVLEGKSDEVLNELTKRMKILSDAKQYEQAARLRNQITALKHIQAKQKIISLKGESQDVISICRQDDIAAANVFVIREGKLIDKLNFVLQHTRDEDNTAVLDAFLKQYYSQATNPPKELIIPVPTTLTGNDLRAVIARESASSVIASPAKRDEANQRLANLWLAIPKLNAIDSGIASVAPHPPPPMADGGAGLPRNDMKITLPHHGKKRELLKLGEANARQYLEQSLASWKKGKNEEALSGLKQTLRLTNIPVRIEGYDISNIQGKFAVGSMVVFTNGEPDKNQYRKFKIKTVRGANDPLMLVEVLKRRFTHTDWPKPDLVLLDGGKGQLATVLRALFTHRHLERSESRLIPPVIATPHLMRGKQSRGLTTGLLRRGVYTERNERAPRNDSMNPLRFLALAKKQEEIFQGPRLKKINLHPRSPASLLLQRARDEAHRFARAYYHLRHSKSVV